MEYWNLKVYFPLHWCILCSTNAVGNFAAHCKEYSASEGQRDIILWFSALQSSWISTMFKQATVRFQSKKKTVMRIEFMSFAQTASCWAYYLADWNTCHLNLEYIVAMSEHWPTFVVLAHLCRLKNAIFPFHQTPLLAYL